jgi:hypothetical protein
MAVRAAALRHLLVKLSAVRIRVAVDASVLGDVEIDARSRVGVAAGAGGRQVLADEREARGRVQVDAEQRGVESVRPVARLAFAAVG